MKRNISMKKILSIFVFCMILTALFATVALADSDYGVTVNGITVTSENKDDILSDGGKVKYDPDTNTLTATEMLSTALNIKGNGATNIVVTASNAPSVADLTITDASDVSVINTGNSAPVINGSADITCSGEVEINSAGYIAVCGNLTVNGATDISVTTSASAPAITGNANITCTGNVEITNDKSIAVNGKLTVNNAADVTVSGAKAPTICNSADITCSGRVSISNSGVNAVYGTLTVNGATDVMVTADSTAPSVSGNAEITCTGNVEITNNKGIAVSGMLTVNSAADVTVSGMNAPALCNPASITCSGNVSITNTGSYAVNGTLTVNGAKDVTVTADSTSPAITSDADITCTGNVTISNENYIAVCGKLTVNNATDVTVSGANAPTLCNPASITCSGNVIITNTGSNAVSGTLTVNGAKDVTVTADSTSPAITSNADITCTGNVTISNENYIAVSGSLTVKGAADVTVSGANAPTINGNADITCSGTAKIVNKGVYALGNLTFNQADCRAFSVKAGETVDSLATVADVEAGNAYGPAAHREKVIYVEPVCSTVTFDANGGTASAESAVTEINGKLASLPDATLEGFAFNGWFTEKDGGEEITLDKVFVADTTVYAHWTELPHVHNLTLVPAKEATATEPGNIAYYTCDGCDLWFADENGETEITDKNSVIIPALGEPTEPEEECGCPFFRWLKAFTESCIKWIKEMPVSVSEWFAGVFNNILTILKIN